MPLLQADVTTIGLGALAARDVVDADAGADRFVPLPSDAVADVLGTSTERGWVRGAEFKAGFRASLIQGGTKLTLDLSDTKNACLR